MAKKILVMCGTGVATSTIAIERLKAWLEKENSANKVTLFQSSVANEIGRLDTYDMVVSTTIVPDEKKDKVIDGVPLLSGIGTEETYQRIREERFWTNVEEDRTPFHHVIIKKFIPTSSFICMIKWGFLVW
ncbi:MULTISPECIES: PTS sugar transporter subunit IIB [Clostridia]|uniref:PTS sugar transporter subunit IIB n=1 Tax=Clostridia TaxID=186801 RepID=UPI000EA16DB5|nr:MULTISPECIES: PTS sugar transporter subunit IIB [Clostridia]NBJ68177.1 PTS galactitol transporter subunit IIB [Roseburia sp. 1XD42-34]RKI81950.1 PTS galactitol transporter subunit IIB [Clostridium sp. 1xD42-85]